MITMRARTSRSPLLTSLSALALDAVAASLSTARECIDTDRFGVCIYDNTDSRGPDLSAVIILLLLGWGVLAIAEKVVSWWRTGGREKVNKAIESAIMLAFFFALASSLLSKCTAADRSRSGRARSTQAPGVSAEMGTSVFPPATTAGSARQHRVIAR